LAVARAVEKKGFLEVPHRLARLVGQIMRYAAATSRAKRNIAADLRGALKPRHERHRAAIMPSVRPTPCLFRALSLRNNILPGRRRMPPERAENHVFRRSVPLKIARRAILRGLGETRRANMVSPA
jgi:hypothetical protein